MLDLLIITESLLVILVIPILLWRLANRVLTKIDNRNMRTVFPCRFFAMFAGLGLALIFTVLSGAFTDTSPDRLWTSNSPWNVSHVTPLIQRYLQGFAAWMGGAVPAAVLSERSIATEVLHLATIFVLFATALNFAVAWMAWRDLSFYRGVLVHLVLSFCAGLIGCVWFLTVFWAMYWLNFWFFLVVLIVFEIRRREARGPVYSF